MAILVITTLARKQLSSSGEYGFLYIVDTDYHGTPDFVVKSIRIKNTRREGYAGHSSGVRGLCHCGPYWYVAGSGNIIHIFEDTAFDYVDCFEVNNVLDIHQIVEKDNLIYVASCGNDRLIVLSEDKVVESVDLRKYANIIDTCGVLGGVWGSGRLHFNSICFVGNDELHLYCNNGMIFNRTLEEVVFCGSTLNSPHDLLPYKSGLFMNNSNSCETLFLYENELNIVFKSSTSQAYTGYNKPGYTRGLCKYNDSLFIGVSPVIVSEVDINTYDHKKSFVVSDNPEEVIYDICLL